MESVSGRPGSVGDSRVKHRFSLADNNKDHGCQGTANGMETAL